MGAVPFILLGVLLSAFLSHYVSEEMLLKIIPKNRLLALLVACFIGFLFPVCECGNVPVARRLIRKGVPPYVAITFLLAAPIINPVTVFSTWAAFSFLPEVVVLRLVFALVIAMTVGTIFSYHPNPEKLLMKGAKPEHKHSDHDHEHDHHGHNHDADEACEIKDGYHVKYASTKFWSFVRSLPEEFLEMMAALSMGALLAGVVQVFIPREIILTVGQGPFISIISMIAFAVIISVCSSVDAFIALSYAGTFTTGSLLAFLVFGPMIDFKAVWMMKTTFKWKAIFYIIALIFLMTVLLTTLYNFYWN